MTESTNKEITQKLKYLRQVHMMLENMSLAHIHSVS